MDAAGVQVAAAACGGGGSGGTNHIKEVALDLHAHPVLAVFGAENTNIFVSCIFAKKERENLISKPNTFFRFGHCNLLDFVVNIHPGRLETIQHPQPKFTYRSGIRTRRRRRIWLIGSGGEDAGQRRIRLGGWAVDPVDWERRRS